MPPRKPTNPNKHKSNKRTKSTKINSLLPKRGNRNTKRTEKHKNKMTHGKTYNKSPRRINHKARKGKTNTGTTALQSLGPYGDLKPESKPHQYIMHVSKKEPFTVWLQYSSLIGWTHFWLSHIYQNQYTWAAYRSASYSRVFALDLRSRWPRH